METQKENLESWLLKKPGERGAYMEQESEKPLRELWINSKSYSGLKLTLWPRGKLSLEHREKPFNSTAWISRGKVEFGIKDLLLLASYAPYILDLNLADEEKTKSADRPVGAPI